MGLKEIFEARRTKKTKSGAKKCTGLGAPVVTLFNIDTTAGTRINTNSDNNNIDSNNNTDTNTVSQEKITPCQKKVNFLDILAEVQNEVPTSEPSVQDQYMRQYHQRQTAYVPTNANIIPAKRSTQNTNGSSYIPNPLVTLFAPSPYLASLTACNDCTLDRRCLRHRPSTQGTEANEVDLCPHIELRVYWTVDDPVNNKSTWRLEVADYTHIEDAHKQHEHCKVQIARNILDSLAERMVRRMEEAGLRANKRRVEMELVALEGAMRARNRAAWEKRVDGRKRKREGLHTIQDFETVLLWKKRIAEDAEQAGKRRKVETRPRKTIAQVVKAPPTISKAQVARTTASQPKPKVVVVPKVTVAKTPPTETEVQVISSNAPQLKPVVVAVTKNTIAAGMKNTLAAEMKLLSKRAKVTKPNVYLKAETEFANKESEVVERETTSETNTTTTSTQFKGSKKRVYKSPRYIYDSDTYLAENEPVYVAPAASKTPRLPWNAISIESTKKRKVSIEESNSSIESEPTESSHKKRKVVDLTWGNSSTESGGSSWPATSGSPQFSN